MAAANLANIQAGGDRVSEQSANLRNGLTSQDEAAELLQVSRRSVQTAAKVKRTAPAEVVEAVKARSTRQVAKESCQERGQVQRPRFEIHRRRDSNDAATG
jgi:hypothetical protein